MERKEVQAADALPRKGIPLNTRRWRWMQSCRGLPRGSHQDHVGFKVLLISVRIQHRRDPKVPQRLSKYCPTPAIVKATLRHARCRKTLQHRNCHPTTLQDPHVLWLFEEVAVASRCRKRNAWHLLNVEGTPRPWCSSCEIFGEQRQAGSTHHLMGVSTSEAAKQAAQSDWTRNATRSKRGPLAARLQGQKVGIHNCNSGASRSLQKKGAMAVGEVLLQVHQRHTQQGPGGHGMARSAA